MLIVLDPQEETVCVLGKAKELWPWSRNRGSIIELNIIHTPSLTDILDLTRQEIPVHTF